MSNNRNNNRVDTVIVLLIFCVFAMSVFLVLILGASIYSNMAEKAFEGQNERIALSFVRTRVRNADSADSISVGDFQGFPALSFEEDLGGRIFVTYIYLYNGWVHELFHERGHYFSPGDGDRMIQADSLSFEKIDGGMIRVSTDYGSLLIFPRSSQKEGALD